MRSKAGMHAPNGGENDGMAASWEKMLDLACGSYLLLHHQRHMATAIRARYPDAHVEIRHYEQLSMQHSPEEIAIAAFGRKDSGESEGYMWPLRDWVTGWTPGNELNISAEGGGKSKGDYERIRDWTLAVAQEVRRRQDWCPLHFPALSPGNGEDQNDGAGIVGYEILRPAIDQYEILDVHHYWLDDRRASLDGQSADWYAQRFRRVHNLFPEKNLAITECNRQWRRDDDDEQRRVADEYIDYIRMIERFDYVLYACWFIFDSPDPAHHWATLADQPLFLDRVRGFCQEEAPRLMTALAQPFDDRFRTSWQAAGSHIPLRDETGIYQLAQRMALQGEKIGPPLTNKYSDPLDPNLVRQPFVGGWLLTWNRATNKTTAERW